MNELVGENPMNVFSTMLVYGFYGLVLLNLFEMIMTWLWWPPIFSFGYQFWIEPQKIKHPKSMVKMSFDTKNGKFRIINRDLIIFRFRPKIIDWYSPGKYTIRCQGDEAIVVGRVPWSLTLLPGWVFLYFASIIPGIFNQNVSAAATISQKVLFLIIVCVPMLAIFTVILVALKFTLNRELHRGPKLLNEFQSHIEESLICAVT